VSIAERDYMRRDDKPPQNWWGYALVIVVSAILLTTFGVQRCSTATGKDRLTKGSLVVNINEATAEELQTLPGVGAARAELIIQNRPYHSVDELVEKRALPKTVVDANRSRLKTTGKNERTARH
jgi:competence ComEA-like helix-hairpin-helix protein